MYFEDVLSKDITMALAHEVKNPVSLIKANIELLEFESVLDDYKKNVSIIKNELNKISEIMSDFMLYCNQYFEEEKKPINIFYLIKDYIEKFNVYNYITFSINCFENMDNIKITGDECKVSFILSNIYKNCVEAINHKNGFIQTNVYMKNKKLVVDIIDNGQGIPKKDLEKIKKPFFTSKKGGSGLGVPICINAMKSLNGKFEIFNNKDKGCTTRLIFNV